MKTIDSPRETSPSGFAPGFRFSCGDDGDERRFSELSSYALIACRKMDCD